jgi:hypothetical protein
MLWTIAIVLLILWLIGLISGNTFYGFLHLLLVFAIAAILVRLITEKRQI